MSRHGWSKVIWRDKLTNGTTGSLFSRAVASHSTCGKIYLTDRRPRRHLIWILLLLLPQQNNKENPPIPSPWRISCLLPRRKPKKSRKYKTCCWFSNSSPSSSSSSSSSSLCIENTLLSPSAPLLIPSSLLLSACASFPTHPFPIFIHPSLSFTKLSHSLGEFN